MYRHLAPHVHIAEIHNCFVLLDARHDRYIPLSRAQSDALRELLGGSSSRSSQFADPSPYIEFFERAGIICGARSPSRDPRFKGEDGQLTRPFDGWHVRPEDFERITPAHKVLRALQALHYVHRKMRQAKLQGLIECVERLHASGNARYRPVSAYALHVAALNRACMVHPRPTKCLVWAVALIVLAARGGDRLDLVIGVARSPFHAHAWAEARGLVIGDDADRRKQFAVICEVGASRTMSLEKGGA